MEKEIKILVLLNREVLIAEIEEVGSELGEPDCKVINPFLIKRDDLGGLSIGVSLEPWLISYSTQNVFRMHSDKILTIANPKPSILSKYEELTK